MWECDEVHGTGNGITRERRHTQWTILRNSQQRFSRETAVRDNPKEGHLCHVLEKSNKMKSGKSPPDLAT